MNNLKTSLPPCKKSKSWFKLCLSNISKTDISDIPPPAREEVFHYKCHIITLQTTSSHEPYLPWEKKKSTQLCISTWSISPSPFNFALCSHAFPKHGWATQERIYLDNRLLTWELPYKERLKHLEFFSLEKKITKRKIWKKKVMNWAERGGMEKKILLS